ncbi:transglycosylase SLT domain-containing protein [uncultured Thiodictyon sp.]|uniref:LysM peptidoglycan-binding domain-containing protein n=1 Tax=uncultured Thiodictyon sp. TaxID=1846217 RepID=UPI0034592F6C
MSLLVGVLALIALLSLGGCGGGGDQREAASDQRPVGSSADFPVPPEIGPNVNFWRNVYGVWGRNKVAIHDDEHMGVIYEVAELPGATQEGYSEMQRAFVRDRLEYYKGQVRELERRLSGNQTLTAQDRALLAKFEQDGGARGVYGAAERVRSQRGLRERFRRGLEISGRYDKAFRESMRRAGLPEDLAYLPHVESSFQTNAVSSAGATGVWQFMPATGRAFMQVNGAVDDRMDPILSADGAARYLSQAHNRLGSWPLAVTSYNHGQGGMANAKAQFGHDFGRIVKNYQGKAFKFASRNYYAEFIAAREVASHPARYFPEGVRYETPWPHDRLVLAGATPADQVASRYGVSSGSLASLNAHWRGAARDGRTALPAGSTVWLPAGSLTRGGGQPSYSGGVMAARASAKPMAEPVAAATSMALRATEAEPDFADLPARDPAYAARVQPAGPPIEPRLAMVEPKPARVQPRPALEDVPDEWPEPVRAARGESRPTAAQTRAAKARARAAAEAVVAEAEAKSAKAPAPRARAELKTAKTDTKGVKAEPKAGKADAKTAKAAAKGGKAEAKTAKAAAKGDKAEAKTAKAEAKGDKADAKTAKAETKGDKADAKTAKAGAKGSNAEAKTAKGGKSEAAANAKYHVVKSQETLYRVASASGISVAELRRLNKMSPNENNVRPGQKLKVGT